MAGPAPEFRVAVLASGEGSNLRALFDARASGALRVDIVGVFSDRPASGAIAFAMANGLPHAAIKPSAFPCRAAFDDEMADHIDGVQPDLIVCAGYMRIISEHAVLRFAGRMINIHPSLLPRHPGLHTHARVLAAGETEHGASVHLVIPALDAGPVLAQARIDVLADDTPQSLARRLLLREHPLLVASVKEISEGNLALGPTAVSFKGTPLPVPLSLNDQDQLELVR